jgi:hypothetical protein
VLGETRIRPAATGTAGSAVLVVALVACALGLVAVLLGLLWLTPPDHGPIVVLLADLAPVAALASWVVALGAAAAGGVLVLRRRDRRARTALVVALPGAVLGTVAVVGAVALLVATIHLFDPNTAEELAAPTRDAYVDRGARLLCDSGDSGHGPDNLTPWYSAVLDVPTSVDVDATAERALRAAGFTPRTDATSDPADAAQPPPATGHVLRGGNAGGRFLGVTVYTAGTPRLDCSNHGVTYGEAHRAPEGFVTIVILGQGAPNAS